MVKFITSLGDFIKWGRSGPQRSPGPIAGQKILPGREDFPQRIRSSRTSSGDRSGSEVQSRPRARSYSSEAQMKGPTPLQSFSMTGSEM